MTVKAGRLVGSLVLGLLWSVSAVQAATFVPVPPDDLARSSPFVVIGTVVGLTGVEAAGGAIYTLVDVEVEEVLKGELNARVITLKEDGGKVGPRRRVLFGVPDFIVGEKVLLYLTLRPDGSLRVNHLALGKFHLEIGTGGAAWAEQELGGGTTMVLPEGRRVPAATMPLAAWRESVARVTTASAPPAGPPEFRSAPPEASDPSLRREVTAAFTLLGEPPARFYEPDEGRALSFLIDGAGDALLGFEASRRLINDAFAAWSDVAAASIALQDGGLTGDLTDPCPGPHKVRFNDPFDELPDPVHCAGTLGVGGFTTLGGVPESKVVNGTEFERASCGVLTLADGWDDCLTWTECNVAEVATHELGHAIGLGHSSERDPEPVVLHADATMYFLAHFDGRCAGVREDDIDGLSFIYPGSVPPTITGAQDLPAGLFNSSYEYTLLATGGVPPFTWSLEDGGFPGLDLSSEGVISGTPSSFGSSFFEVKVTDGNGDSHTKTFFITVLLNEQTPTPTPRGGAPSATPTASLTPVPTACPTPSAKPTFTATLSPTLAPPATATPTATPAVPGDANCDSDITPEDIAAAAAAVFGAGGAPLCGGANCNQDGVVSAADVTCVVQRLASGG